MNFVDLKAQYDSIQEDIDGAIARVIGSCGFIMGEELEQFEREFAKYCGCQYGLGTSSGTTALHLALIAAGVGKGFEVITTPYTFFATAEVISLCGATPVFVDIDPDTYNLDISQVESAITDKTVCILPVHLFGHPVDIPALMNLAFNCSSRFQVIEDACQAHGAEFEGRKVGGLGHAGCFSFYPTKNLGAYGDAGALVTRDNRIAEHARILRHHGGISRNEHQAIGYSYLMDALQAAILRAKLGHLERWNDRRREIAALYEVLLADTPLVLPCGKGDVKHVFHVYTVRAENGGDRIALRAHLENVGIPTIVYYPIPVHRQRAYRSLGYKKGSMPVAEHCAETCLSLPIYPELADSQVKQIAEYIRVFYGSKR